MKSLCPKCGRLVQNRETVESGNVYVTKTCPEHGTIKTLVSTDADYWTESLKYDRPGTKPLVWSSSQDKGCPNDCGICPHKTST